MSIGVSTRLLRNSSHETIAGGRAAARLFETARLLYQSAPHKTNQPLIKTGAAGIFRGMHPVLANRSLYH